MPGTTKNPTVRAAVFVIFAGPNPPAGPLLQAHTDPAGPLAEIVKTPMMRFAEVREYVLAALADPGEMEKSETTGGDAKVKCRVGDFYASQLAQWKGLPAIEFTWPKAQRDTALAECMRVVREPGTLFDGDPPGRQAGAWATPGEEN